MSPIDQVPTISASASATDTQIRPLCHTPPLAPSCGGRGVGGTLQLSRTEIPAFRWVDTHNSMYYLGAQVSFVSGLDSEGSGVDWRTQCPACGQDYAVQDQQLGSQVRCGKCGHAFTVEAKSSEVRRRGASHLVAVSDVPQQIGSLQVKRELGAGGMGVVYLGHDRTLGRDVAIKVLPEGFATNKQRLRRFLREARTAAHVHNTHVATVYHAGVEQGCAYIAMEFVDGGSLDKAISSEKPMPWREATGVVRDAAIGLAAAHAKGLIHRDIKPANLMRTREGVTKVVDFGLARAQAGQTHLTQEGSVLGTPAFMSPEQWRGQDLDDRSDIYSLACSYYYLLTGRAPFEDAAVGALGHLHCNEPFPDPRDFVADLPDGVCRILSQGVAKEPSQRFQSAQKFADALTALLETPRQSLLFDSPWHELARSSTPPPVVPPPPPARPPNVNVVVQVGGVQQSGGDSIGSDGPLRSRQIAGVLAIVLGCLGVHRFYLNYIGLGLIQLVITLGSCGYGAIITIPWGIVEGVLILQGRIERDGLGRGLLD